MTTPLSMSTGQPSRAAKMLGEIFASGRPLTYIHSPEEQRVARVLQEAGSRMDATPIWSWSLTQGMSRSSGEPAARTAREALDFIASYPHKAIFHLKDFHEPLRASAEIRRRLRDVYEACLDRGKFMVISSPVRSIPEEVEREMLFLELRPPDVVELSAFLRDELAGGAGGSPLDTSDANLNQMARSLQGLTLDEARYALRRALAADPALGPAAIPALLEEKRLL